MSETHTKTPASPDTTGAISSHTTQLHIPRRTDMTLRPVRRTTTSVPAAGHHQPHHAVTKFTPTTEVTPQTDEDDDIPAIEHPLAETHRRKRSAQTARVSKPKTSKEIKEHAISHALSTTPASSPHDRVENTRRRRKIAIIVGTIIAIGLVCYIVYATIPNISVQIASFRAGIPASYPSYRPAGYRFDGPVVATEGEVRVSFRSNTNSSTFTLIQTKSGWNSDAVRLMVDERSNGQYITTQDRGLTIYSYAGNAAWVNGGILYQLEGNPQFTSDEIAQIAASL